MADADTSAMSGGLLVVLGIIVAIGLGFFFFNGGFKSGPSAPDISVTLPTPSNQ